MAASDLRRNHHRTTRSTRTKFGFIAACLLSCAVTASCGKKGPPLAPFVRIPSTPEIVGTRRAGGDIYVSVKVPTANIDASQPASLAQIELYAVTSLTPPPRAQFLAVASRVATIPVAREADPADTSGTVVADPSTGALQGSTITIRDALTAQAMQPKQVPAENQPRPPAAAPAPAPSEPVPQLLRRFYMTIAFSDRRRSSPPSAVAEIPLTTLPARVPAVRASLTGNTVALDWDPSGGLLGWLLERRLPPEISPVDEGSAKPTASTAGGDLPSGPTTYNVYREMAPDPFALPAVGTPALPPPAEPINGAPLSGLTFSEEVPFDGRRRCYRISAVRGTGPGRVESDFSDRSCIDPIDVEPPTAVTGLTARAMDGVITLLWEPNGELDLRGYLVLRREAGDDTLQRLTPNPIRDTRWDDKTVVAGRMYTYLVHAVDTRLPLPNLSDPAEVTETAR